MALLDVPPLHEYPSDKIEVRFESLGVRSQRRFRYDLCVANDPFLQCRRKEREQLPQVVLVARGLSLLVKRESLEPDFDREGVADQGRHKEEAKAARGEPFELVAALRRKVEDL